MSPTVVIETSPDSYHVWITASETELPNPVATQLAKILEQKYSRDKGSADSLHLGRLPGLRNKKPKYQTYPGGGGPLALLRTARTFPIVPESIGVLLEQAYEMVKRGNTPSPSARGGCAITTHHHHQDDDEALEVYENGRHIVTMSAQYDIGNVETAYGQVLEEMMSNDYEPPVRSSGSDIDRSKLDIAIAHYLHRRCVSKDIIIKVLQHGSDKAAERGMDYVIKTVDAALRS